MKEELEQIAISLAKWCKKYGKNSVQIDFFKDAVWSSIHDDKRHWEDEVFFEGTKLEEKMKEEGK